MNEYLIGDTILRYQGEFPLAPDEFTDRFLLPGPGIEVKDTICYESAFFDLERFASFPRLARNGMYELYDLVQDRALIYHWATCRFGYGFLCSALQSGSTVHCWFSPNMKKVQPPLAAVRFFSTAGLHSKFLQLEAPILHASYIDYKGRAILFTAPSQTGKSTQANLWHAYTGAEIINGDRVLLRRRGTEWHAFGYPCCGSSNICINRTLPLAVIVVLAQGPENTVEKMRPAEQVRALFSATERYLWDTAETDLALSLAQQLICQIPVVRLVCRPDQDAVHTLQKFLKSEEIL